MWLPLGCRWQVLRCCWGREGSSCLFVKVGDEFLYEKGPPLLKYFLSTSFLLVLQSTCMRTPTSGLSDSILNDIFFIYFCTIYQNLKISHLSLYLLICCLYSPLESKCHGHSWMPMPTTGPRTYLAATH